MQRLLSTCRSMASTSAPPVARLSIAPMMDWTDRHYRFMMRLITKHTLLYTEMLVDQTILHQQHNLDYFLGHDPVEAPLAIQLGGNSVHDLGVAARICTEYGGFREINLNTGCPSALVASRCFGARLMLEPELVHDICRSMLENVSELASPHTEEGTPFSRNGVAGLPDVTVKCRIGVDDHDSYEELQHFVATVARAGVTHIIVHARKCLLNGLSTHENRTIPPLKYDWVFRLKTDFPELRFTLNGGVQNIQQVKELLETTNLDGVMIGRAAYNAPWEFRDADRLIFGAESNPNRSRREVIAEYLDYAERMQAKWGITKITSQRGGYCMPTSALVKPLLALFSGASGGKAFKREIAARFAHKGPKPGIRELIEGAMRVIPDEVLDERIEDELLRKHQVEEEEAGTN